MRCLKRNQQPIWYCTFRGKSELIDENGNRSGEKVRLYNEPVKMFANVSHATGQSSAEIFGNLENYDKVIVTDDTDCPISESSVLFIDKLPKTTEVLSNQIVESTALLGDDETETALYIVPEYDYIVRRVSKSINSVSIAVRKVTVS